MSDEALYEYIHRELDAAGAESLDEVEGGIVLPDGVDEDQFLRVLEEVETDIRDERLA